MNEKEATIALWDGVDWWEPRQVGCRWERYNEDWKFTITEEITWEFKEERYISGVLIWLPSPEYEDEKILYECVYPVVFLVGDTYTFLPIKYPTEDSVVPKLRDII